MILNKDNENIYITQNSPEAALFEVSGEFCVISQHISSQPGNDSLEYVNPGKQPVLLFVVGCHLEDGPEQSES